MTLPITSRSGELRLPVRGERLDSMNKLARVELPPWGPWSFGGSFRASPRGYEVPDLEVHVGSSSLDGHGTLNVAGERPRLDVSLTAPRVQLERFPVRHLVALREEGEEAGQAHERGGDAREGQGGRGAGAEAAEPRDAAARRRLSGRRGGAGSLGRRPARQRQAARATGERQARVRTGDSQRARGLGQSQAQLRADAERCRGGGADPGGPLRLRHTGPTHQARHRSAGTVQPQRRHRRAGARPWTR